MCVRGLCCYRLTCVSQLKLVVVVKRTEEEKTCKNQSDLLFVYSGRGNGCEVSVFDVGCWVCAL